METLERDFLSPSPQTPSFDVTGWVLRVSAAILFLSVGLSKFESDSHWVRLFAAIGLGDWFRYVTGALQVVGGALFLVPKTVPAAAALAGATMLGAVAVHLFVLGTGVGGAIIPAIVLAFVACVALRRVDNDETRSVQDAALGSGVFVGGAGGHDSMAGERDEPEHHDGNDQLLIEHLMSPSGGCGRPDAGTDVPVSNANRLPHSTPQSKELDSKQADGERHGGEADESGGPLLG